MQLKAQIRSLRSQLGRRPWVFARLAELEVLEGRTRTALKRLRQGVRQFPTYASGHQVLGELLLSLGQSEEARKELLQASSCCDSPHAAFEVLVDELATPDPEVSRGLLEEAWSRDRLNSHLRDRMKKADLIREPTFREILVPTDGERRARDEEIAALIRRLIEAVEAQQPAIGAEPVVPDTQPDLDTAEETPAPEVPPRPAGSPAAETPPPSPAIPVPDLPDHGALFMARPQGGPPRPIRSRSLARVYDEQGYLELALGVVRDLQAAGIAGGDPAGLENWRQDLERRIAERNG